SDEWYLWLKNQTISCTVNDKYSAVGGSYDNGRHSPENLLSSTMGDELKFSNFFKSKVVGISLDPSSAVLSAGHVADAAYWYDANNGKWITSTYYMDSLPAWVEEFNLKAFPHIYMERTWDTYLPIEEYTESLPDKNEYETGINDQITFPYDLSAISKKWRRKNKVYDLLKYTPFGNSLTKDFAINAIVEEELGKDDITDMLFVTFSSSEHVGELFGPNSVEIEDVFLRLDKDISHFMNFLDDEIGLENVLIYMTSDHGVAPVPQYLIDRGVPGGVFNRNYAMSLLSSYLNVIYGKGDWIKYYFNQQLYLNQDLIEGSELSLREFQETVAHFMLQYTGVSNVITSYTLMNTDFSGGIFKKIQNSYHQKRSGDVIINLSPGWIEKSGNVTLHNSSYVYDAHVPLIWYGWKIKRKSLYRPVSPTDIAPTIAHFLGILAPNGSTGEPIYEMID
ncbi:MAG: alkaline phosphatase family protein, partial [Bacteroidota bacterium]